MGLYNVSLSDSDDGLVIVADNVGNVINSSTITNLAYEISWYPWHWQKAHLDEILGSNTPLSGNDILIGGNGSDSVDSGAGNDQIFTGVGNDIAAGGDGYDLLFTGSGDDIGIFASPNTQGFDSYFGGTGNDTLVLALDYQDYKLAEQEIIAYVSQLNSGGENNPFTFNNLGLTATGWENLKVQVAPVIQTGQSVELTEPVGNNGQSGEITATGSLYFSDDAFSQQTVNTTLVLADWSAGELSDELEDLFAESFGGALITGQSDVKAIEWSFSVADTELDFLAAGEKLELSYQVLVSDGQLSDSELVSVIVTGTNDGPIAQHMSTVTSEDAPTATFTLDFSDPDANETHTVSFTTENGVPVNVTDNGDGSFTFLPVGNYEALAAGETATELLIYTVTDATGETSSASISIVIEGQNDAPELKDANISGSESAGSIEIDLTLLGTDVDSDNNGETLSYSISSSPQKGIANIVGQKLVFETGGDFTVLNAGETEVIVIEVTATDNIGASVSNTVTISVEGTNDPNAILTVQDLSAAKLGFEFEGFDLDTGQVITSDIPGLPLNSETYDFTFAYNGNFPVSGTNAVVFQNQTSQTPVEIAFIDETSLLDLTQNHVDLAVFSTNLIDQQFESDDTILLKTQSGDIYAIGNSSENDLPGQDFSVDFDYALISAPVSNDPLLSQVNVTSTSLEIEFQAFDLDSGTAEMALDPLFLGETADFKFAYNGNFPTEEANSALFQNQFSTIPVEIAFLDEVSLFSLSQNHADQAVFTTDLIDQQFESDDTILLKTQSGDVYAIGNSQENDLPGQDFTVNFDYANLSSPIVPETLLTVQDLSAAKLGFEFEGFDLDTGQVITSDIPGLPLNSETYDFTFAYNGNFPVSGTNAVVFQNQTSQTPVEIAFIDETSLLDLTQNHVDLAVFSTNLIDQQFESDDTILLKTQSGDIYAIGNSSENDLPGQDFSVDFDYALISAPVSNDPLLSQVNVTSTSLEIEFQAFDLDSGTAEMALDPLFLGETADFKFAYNGNFPTEEANSALFQNQFSTIPVEIAFLDEVSLFSLSQNHVDQAVFTTDLIDQQFESDDTILLKTQSGDVYAIGNSQENDLPGQDFTVNFDYANLTGLF